ncbi:hypothetical protein BHM03_00055827 [Ensete ventricosum]|nr:hypothetical protein BHM03_00055827 [Ensete ventricosum]
MLSTASCLGQWIIIVSFPSLNKPSLFTRFLTSALALRDCIPDLFFIFSQTWKRRKEISFKKLVIYP